MEASKEGASLRPRFHLAFPVHDLEAARRFYGDVLGCNEGRSSDHWVDFDLAGHQLVAHQSKSPGTVVHNPVDGDAVPVPHFGLILDWEAWHALADRLRAAGMHFVIEPRVRFKGKPGEQATMFFRDPSGNNLEFKAFRDDAAVFATSHNSAALTRDEAWELLTQWTPSQALRQHARAVEIVMRAAALHYGRGVEDQEQWGMAGLLHDADYDQWPEEHPHRIVAWLRQRGEEELAYAISGHFTQWGVVHKSLLDKALVACDELTGFVGACCLVRPEGITTLKPKSVRKKLKTRSFAAKVDRTEVTLGAELLGVELSDHIQFVIDALRPHGVELGLQGRVDKPASGK